MSRFQPRRLLLPIAAPLVAVVVAFIITSLVLLAVGDPVMDVWRTIFQVPLPRPRTVESMGTPEFNALALELRRLFDQAAGEGAPA